MGLGFFFFFFVMKDSPPPKDMVEVIAFKL